MTACAAKNVRECGKEMAIMQVGNKDLVFAASLWGEMLLRQRPKQTMVVNRTSPEDPPRPCI